MFFMATKPFVLNWLAESSPTKEQGGSNAPHLFEVLMATAQQLINRTLRLLGVKAEGQTATPEQSVGALDAMNDMLFAWRDQGVDLGHTALALGDTIPYQDDHLAAIRYSLAVELAPEYGRPVQGEIAANQMKYFRALQALYCNPPFMATEAALNPYYTRRRYH
jgi:hypothetical protein